MKHLCTLILSHRTLVSGGSRERRINHPHPCGWLHATVSFLYFKNNSTEMYLNAIQAP